MGSEEPWRDPREYFHAFMPHLFTLAVNREFDNCGIFTHSNSRFRTGLFALLNSILFNGRFDKW